MSLEQRDAVEFEVSAQCWLVAGRDIWISKLIHGRNPRYHIVEEFNRGKYDYIVATDESDPAALEHELQIEQVAQDEASEASSSKLIPSGVPAEEEEGSQDDESDEEEQEDGAEGEKDGQSQGAFW